MEILPLGTIRARSRRPVLSALRTESTFGTSFVGGPRC